MARTGAARHVLPLALAVLLCLLVAITALGIARMGGMEQRLRHLADTQRVKSALLSSMLRNIHERAQLLNQNLNQNVPAPGTEREGARRYDALSRAYGEKLDRWRAIDASPLERSRLDDATTAQAAVVALHREVLARIAAGEVDAARELYREQAADGESRWEDALYEVLEASGASAMGIVDEARAATRQGLFTIAAVGALLLALGTLIAVSVTRRVRRTERDLEREKELAQVTLHSIGDGVITTDAGGWVEYLNPVAEKYTGWRSDDARGRRLGEIYRIVDESTGADVDPFTAQQQPDGDDDRSVTVRLVDREGRECPVRYSHAPIHSRHGRRLGTILVFHDVSQIRAMAEQLLWQASHDALTGLVNRREFERRLSELAATARTLQQQHVLLYMDLDNFKAVNDTCGHVAGDELLRQLTAVMVTRMRGSDTLARLGGDEFGVLLQACPVEQAVRIANGIREAVREFRFVWENKSFSVGISIGVVAIDADSPDVSLLLARADASCYEAKNRGRDVVHVYRPDSQGDGGSTGELQVVSQINQAFESGRFRLYRQAIVPLQGACGGQRHYEVLVRMLSADGEVLPPTAFMPAAERYNLLTSIERWVISSLLEYLDRLWQAGGVPVDPAECGYYAVNISGASVNDRSFPDFLRNLLTRYALPPGLLCFEITETTAIASLSKAAELIHEFKQLGCRFSLDDFGTGMSSFAYLKYLPVDTLKIAGMFVKDMAHDPMDAAIVEAIHRISHILGMQTVAESVEDAATLGAVARMGIDFAQGYHIAEPEALQPVALQRPPAPQRETT